MLKEGSVLNDNTASSHKSNKPSSMDCGPNKREEDNDNVVEAHCYALQCRRIDCEQIRSRINQQLIAGRFGHEGLRQLRTNCFVRSFVCS